MTSGGGPAPVSLWPLRCSNCRRTPPEGSFPHRCPHCQGLYELSSPIDFVPPTSSERRGLDRYRHLLPLPPEAPLVSLGEGGTPLVGVRVRGRNIYFKCEHLNPTGSFKDRGSAVLVSALMAAGVRQAVEDSSGNAGASFAAYTARAGLHARVFIPDSTSPAKRAQIEAAGAEVVSVLGPRTAAAEAVQREAAAGAVYASHAYLPLGQAGLATLAYEVVEQLGGAPGSLVLPVGHGTLLLGCAAGFESMRSAGLIDRLPQLIAVQVEACAPLWAVLTGGAAGLAWVREGPTRAEGIRILQPLRGDAVLRAVEGSLGTIVPVSEKQIDEGEHELGRLGFYVEPTSAVVWPAALELLDRLPDPIVLVLTGSGYKTPAPDIRP